LGDGREERVAHVQRPRRDDHGEPAFREAFRRRRCIVPVDSFYEWKREGTVRQPYRVSGTTGCPLLLQGCGPAGMTRRPRRSGGPFTIVTTTPNDAMADLHDRMPVVLDERCGIAG
jgi:putative SOS response-associated peptidase YedK